VQSRQILSTLTIYAYKLALEKQPKKKELFNRI